jgi:imidazolonepropionase
MLFTNARILTPGGVIGRGWLRTDGERIDTLGEGDAPSVKGAETIDARGRVLMPAFVDCHTHACWAGDRLDEWDRKRAGATYLEILQSGGGIMSTVRGTRAASQAQLADGVRERLAIMLREGTTTVEIKSGYGLATEHELKMLRAIRDAADDFAGAIVPTALIGHAVDKNNPRYFDETIAETLPAVHDEFPGVAIDAYCEEGAWPLHQCERLFRRAIELGHPCRVHADQFNALGMTRFAAAHGFRSVDHLEASTAEELRDLAASETMGVALPCSGFQVDDRYADARRLLDLGGRVAIATNCNPGSAPTSSMPFAIALAVRRCGMTPREAIDGATREAATVLSLDDRAAIAPGMRADLILLRHTDERMLAYEFGGNPVDVVICAGRRV